MNRHFYNFIAMFNKAAKTGKWTFVVPLRNKFIFTFINYLLKEKLIEDYRFTGRVPDFSDHALKLGKTRSPYYYPIEIRLKHELVKGIFSVSTPGKPDFMNFRALNIYTQRTSGVNGVVICSSSKLAKLCTAPELLKQGEGGLVVCVVRLM